MNPEDEFAGSYGVERRVSGPVDEIDEAVVIATVEGVGPAIDHMFEAGIERGTALRVLSSPKRHRKVSHVTHLEILKVLGMQPRHREWWRFAYPDRAPRSES